MASPRQIEVKTFVDNGKFVKNRDLIVQAIEQYEGKEITVILKRYFKKRSNKQNNYWHGVIVEHWKNILLTYWGEVLSHDEVHEFLKANLNYEYVVDTDTGELLLNPLTHEPIKKIKSTKTNTTFTQEELSERARQLAWEMFEYHIPLPDPNLKAKF